MVQKFLSIRTPAGGWTETHLDLFDLALEGYSDSVVADAFREVGTSWTHGWPPLPGDVKAVAARLSERGVERREFLARNSLTAEQEEARSRLGDRYAKGLPPPDVKAHGS